MDLKVNNRNPKLLDQIRTVIRRKHYSIRTEQTYTGWVKRYIFFHGKRHPKNLGKPAITAFLNHLAIDRKVAASTQNQALSALVFLYKEVLDQEFGWLENLEYAKRRKLPLGHIHVHNYFITYEIKLHGSKNWQKIVDKGWLTAMSDPEIRVLATKYGDPDKLLSYDWIPPLPGINCEGNYLRDYAPNPVAYLKKRLKENKSI